MSIEICRQFVTIISQITPFIILFALQKIILAQKKGGVDMTDELEENEKRFLVGLTFCGDDDLLHLSEGISSDTGGFYETMKNRYVKRHRASD